VRALKPLLDRIGEGGVAARSSSRAPKLGILSEEGLIEVRKHFKPNGALPV